MSTPRISERNYAYSSLAGLQAAIGKLARLQSQLASGRQITKPSDDPSGTVAALEMRSQTKRLDQYQANASDAIGWLTQVDTTLSSTVTQLQQVRTLVLKAANTGGNDATARQAIAEQVRAARSSVLALANTQYLGRPIFGGTTGGTVAFNDDGTYAGDDETITRRVGDSTVVQINQPGTAVFASGGNNVFDLLDQIASDITANPSALSGDLTNLDDALHTVSAQQAQEGAVYAQIEQVQQAAGATSTRLASQLSELQDIDVPATVIKVSTANLAYQAALQTTANIRQVSLLDFLR